MAGQRFLTVLIGCLLIGGQCHISAKDGWNYIWEQFWAQQPDRTETGVHL